MKWICPLCKVDNNAETDELFSVECVGCRSVFSHAYIGEGGILHPKETPALLTRIVKITPCPLAQRFTVLHADAQEVRLLVEDVGWTDRDFLLIDVSVERKTKERNSVHYGRPRILTAGAKGGLRFLP